MSGTSTYQPLLAATLIGGLLLAACDSSTEPMPLRIEVEGDNQVAAVGSTLSSPLAVWVSDSGGRPVQGVAIEWTLAQGSGSLSTAGSVTGFAGGAQTSLTLGLDEGTSTVVASAPSFGGTPPVTFTARAVTAVVSMVFVPEDCYPGYPYCEVRAFHPSAVVVPTGKTVAWKWERGRSCNVIFEDDPTEPVSSQTQETGIHFRTFDIPGTFRFRCTHHSAGFGAGMVGTVTVQ